MWCAASAAAAAAQQLRRPAIPEGAEERSDGQQIVCINAPSWATLQQVVQNNRQGKPGGGHFKQDFEINQAGIRVAVPVAGLWAAARNHGGLHLVRD